MERTVINPVNNAFAKEHSYAELTLHDIQSHRNTVDFTLHDYLG